MRIEPTLDELARLYRAAIAFREAQTWLFGDVGDFVAVENPETGIVGFVFAEENLGDDEPGAIVVLDPEGMRVHQAIDDVERVDFTDLPWRRNAVMVAFEQLDLLDAGELAELDRLDVDIPPDAVPVFMRETPGLVPLPPEGPVARFAAIALEQAIECFATLTERLEAHDDSAAIPVRVLREGVWSDEWRSFTDVLTVDYGTPPPARPAWLDLARTVKRHSRQWEFAAMLLPTMADENAGPQLTCLHMIVDKEEVIASKPEPHRDPEGLCAFLFATIQHHRIRPRSLVVADPGLAHAVSELARVFDIDVELAEYLPTVGPLYAQMLADAYHADTDGVDEDIDDVDGVDDDDEPAYDLPTGRREVELPEGFRVRTVTIDYDVVADPIDPESEESVRIAEAFERVATDPEAVVDELRVLIEQFPANETLHIGLMSTLASLGREDEARAAGARARAAFPYSFEMRVALANLLVELDDGPAALAELDGASELADLFPGRTEFTAGDLLLFHTSLYRIHMVLGRLDQAEADLEALNRILPGHPDFAMVAESHARLRASGGNGSDHS